MARFCLNHFNFRSIERFNTQDRSENRRLILTYKVDPRTENAEFKLLSLV